MSEKANRSMSTVLSLIIILMSIDGFRLNDSTKCYHNISPPPFLRTSIVPFILYNISVDISLPSQMIDLQYVCRRNWKG
ncbi:hypothetical protein BD410DRAFT_642795 [Rickenella mellea]|uniref:Uncharacterized protein n=1 Tax=Rickenella mellea TaxID=50990 RepID=A0A4Y7PMB8_9AGAM|nr:hypothetical protein BD410DRAFT_642795 [Rickenella mellea]